MKRCARCGEEKDEEEFNWRWIMLSRRRLVCRICQRVQGKTLYERHAKTVPTWVTVTKKMARGEAEGYIYEYLSYLPCLDRGAYDFAVLPLDHVRGKKKRDNSAMAAQDYFIKAL